MTIKIHEPNPGQLAFENTDPAHAVLMALCAPRGVGMINELANDRPYREGPICGEPVKTNRTSFDCPYCKARVVSYQYPNINLSVYLCKEIAFFVRTGNAKVTRSLWRRMIQQTARAWVKVAANQATGRN
jgi:hypothetical protein